MALSSVASCARCGITQENTGRLNIRISSVGSKLFVACFWMAASRLLRMLLGKAIGSKIRISGNTSTAMQTARVNIVVDA